MVYEIFRSITRCCTTYHYLLLNFNCLNLNSKAFLTCKILNKLKENLPRNICWFKDTIGKLVTPIPKYHQQEWYIQGLLPFTGTPLVQQRIISLADALKREMKIEAMVGYPGSIKYEKPSGDNNLSQP